MKGRFKKKLMASVMAGLMAVTLIPTGFVGGEVNAKAGEAVTLDLKEEHSKEGKVAKIIEIDDHFALMGGQQNTSNGISDKNVSVAKKPTSGYDDLGDGYIAWITGGSVSAGIDNVVNALRMKVDEKSDVTITYAAGSGIKDGSVFGLYTYTSGDEKPALAKDSQGNVFSHSASTSVTKDYTFKNVEAGTYYAGFSNKGGYISAVTITPVVTTAAKGTAPVIASAASKQNDDNSVDITWTTSTAGDGDGKVVIEKSTDGGSTFTAFKTVAYDAEAKVTDTLTGSGNYVYKVYGAVGDTNNADTDAKTTALIEYTLKLDTPKISSVATKALNNATYVQWGKVAEVDGYTVTVYEGDSVKKAYNVESTETGYDIEGLTAGTEYSFTVTAKKGNESTVSEKVTFTAQEFVGFTADALADTDKSGDDSDFTQYLKDSSASLKVLAVNSDKTATTENIKWSVKGNNQTCNGFAFTKRFQTESKNSSPTVGALELTITEKSYIVTYFRSASSGTTENYVIYDKANNKAVKTVKATYDLSMAIVNLDAGTYCIYPSSNKAWIYGIEIHKGSAPLNEWDSIADPVLSDATVNSDGTITVKVNGLTGPKDAEECRVTLYQNGYEVSTESLDSVDEDGATVTFKPKNDGTYTMKAVLVRSGEADKVSDEVSVTGFKKPIDTPTVTWTKNLGNGSVYLDWDNVEADSYEVAYSTDGKDYTAAATGLTTGNYTVTGLTVGQQYYFKVTAKMAGYDDVPYETAAFTVTQDEGNEWFAAAIGSQTSGTMTLDGSSKELTTAAGEISGLTAPASGTTVSFSNAGNGKIADSEDGFMYYYTRINPNTENFKLTATFTIDNLDKVDNQTGFGIYAVDKAGFGSKDAKYFNSVSVGNFKASNGNKHQNVSRLTTGYVSYDTENNADVTRNLDNSHIFSVQPDSDTLKVGDTFTYTLEKTNDSYIASMTGADGNIVWTGTASMAVQEDGSMCVGVASARCVGVTVSNIEFTKSQGSMSVAEATKTTPEFKVYSSNVSATANYLFIGGSNVAGTLKFYVDGSLNKTVELEANTPVSIPVTLWTKSSTNNMSYEFTPAASEDLANSNTITGSLKVTWKSVGEQGETIIVSPDGSKDGEGTMESPMDVQTAINLAQPGQMIVMLDGTYYPTSDYVIPRSVSGTADAPIVIMAQNPGKVVVDGSNMSSSNGLMTLVASYWQVYGIDFTNSPGKGFGLSGNYNTVEMCNFYKNKNTGLQISRYSGEPNSSELWPSYNLVKNCDAYDNCDDGRNDADGFAAKLTCGEGNVFYGCISHNNIDDGWDLFAKSTTGSIGAVTIENCVTYSNGWLTYEDPAEVGYGEGNGFKLGGENMPGAHKLINCVSFNNAGKGITSNSGPDCQVINCTAYNNSLKGGTYNVSLYTKTSNVKGWKLSGVISIATNGTTAAELGSSNGVVYSLRSENNYLFDGSHSYNTLGVEAKEDWFESVDVSVLPTRNADGTINMHGLLVLKASAPADAGARLDTTSDKAKSVQPVAGKIVTGSAAYVDDDDDDDDDDDASAVTVTTTDTGLNVIGESVGVIVPAGTIIRNAAGEIVTSGDVYIKAAQENEESRLRIENAMTENGIAFGEGTGVNFYEVTFEDAFGNPLTFEGSLLVTFKFPEGTGVSGFSYKVLHLLKSGTLDVMDPIVTEAGISVSVTELSPFAVAYAQASADGSDAVVTSVVSAATGDRAPILPLAVVLLAAMAAFGGAYGYRRRNML